jgi:hypothetical protein
MDGDGDGDGDGGVSLADGDERNLLDRFSGWQRETRKFREREG